METAALLLTLIILIVLWLILIALTTHDFRMKRDVHRQDFHLRERR
jgi:hypothetical protein